MTRSTNGWSFRETIFMTSTAALGVAAHESATGAQADRANTDDRRRDGGRESITGSSLDLRCRVHHFPGLLLVARPTPARWTQRVINTLSEIYNERTTYL